MIDSKKIHYLALNEALSEHCDGYKISWDTHLATFDGLSTRMKLQRLEESGVVRASQIAEIEAAKQSFTREKLSRIEFDPHIYTLFNDLRALGYRLSIASNSIRKTVDEVVSRLDIGAFLEGTLSNQDVRNPKPHPEIYWTSMSRAGVFPHQTCILEDSSIGRRAALLSGAKLLPIDRPADLSVDDIVKKLPLDDGIYVQPPWKPKKLNILIPMAGAGSRFIEAGYTFPKPLIEVSGKAMIERVVANLNVDGNFIFLVRDEHLRQYNLEPYLKLLKNQVQIVTVNELTEGAAITALLARELIDTEEPLLIANSDQIIEWDSSETLYSFGNPGIDGGIITFQAHHPKWSFARVDSDGWVTEVAEKLPISDFATAGIYYWARGRDFVRFADQMIRKNIRTNGEFYICPVYNEAIADGLKIKASSARKMWGLGTPEDLSAFLADPEARNYLSLHENEG